MKQLLITIAALVLVGCGPSISIHKASEEGNIEVVKQHLAAGTDVNAKGIWDNTPLKDASDHGHKEIVELLIAKGADVNAKDISERTPLHGAALFGYPEIVELLITKGADVNAKDDRGETPLDPAVNYKPTEIPDLLRKHGAKTSEELSIHKAAAKGNIEAVKQHLAAGADVNAKDGKNGKTPLDIAFQQQIIDLLRKHGAKTSAELRAAGN